MSDPKKPEKKAVIEKYYAVAIDDLTVGGICNGLKKGTKIRGAILNALKKTMVKIDKNNKSLFDVLVLSKSIKLVEAPEKDQ